MTDSEITRKKTSFSPEKHGFAFVNSFRGLPFTGLLDRIVDAERRIHGLCGGMCFTALDHYHHGKPLPEDLSIPPKDSRLYRILAARQSDSWGMLWRGIASYARRMAWSDAKALRENGKTWQIVKKEIDAGKPVVLGLVFDPIPISTRLKNNHQVIGYGYTETKDEGITIDLYDPNYGQTSDVKLTLSPEGDGFRARVSKGAAGHEVHTFFRVLYKPRIPRI